jgi:hypothetical protein
MAYRTKINGPCPGIHGLKDCDRTTAFRVYNCYNGRVSDYCESCSAKMVEILNENEAEQRSWSAKEVRRERGD